MHSKLFSIQCDYSMIILQTFRVPLSSINSQQQYKYRTWTTSYCTQYYFRGSVCCCARCCRGHGGWAEPTFTSVSSNRENCITTEISGFVIQFLNLLKWTAGWWWSHEARWTCRQRDFGPKSHDCIISKEVNKNILLHRKRL